jgi:hypothetical protein
VHVARVQTAGGLEQALGGAQLAELVEGDAGHVGDRRLARLGLEQAHGGVGHGGEGGRYLRGLGSGHREARLEQPHPCLVAAVDVLDRGRLGEQRRVGGQLPGGDQALGADLEQDPGRRRRRGRERGGAGAGGIGEPECHAPS